MPSAGARDVSTLRAPSCAARNRPCACVRLRFTARHASRREARALPAAAERRAGDARGVRRRPVPRRVEGPFAGRHASPSARDRQPDAWTRARNDPRSRSRPRARTVAGTVTMRATVTERADHVGGSRPVGRAGRGRRQRRGPRATFRPVGRSRDREPAPRTRPARCSTCGHVSRQSGRVRLLRVPHGQRPPADLEPLEAYGARTWWPCKDQPADKADPWTCTTVPLGSRRFQRHAAVHDEQRDDRDDALA